jgi:hypothetical protein
MYTPHKAVVAGAERFVGGNRCVALALLAVVRAADASGHAKLGDIATRYREDYLAQLRVEGRDADREAGRLSLDEVRTHLATAVLPRLAAAGAITIPPDADRESEFRVSIGPVLWEVFRKRKVNGQTERTFPL